MLKIGKAVSPYRYSIIKYQIIDNWNIRSKVTVGHAKKVRYLARSFSCLLTLIHVHHSGDLDSIASFSRDGNCDRTWDDVRTLRRWHFLM